MFYMITDTKYLKIVLHFDDDNKNVWNQILQTTHGIHCANMHERA